MNKGFEISDLGYAVDYWFTRSGRFPADVLSEAGLDKTLLTRMFRGQKKLNEEKAKDLALALRIPKNEQEAFLLLASGKTREQVREKTGNNLLYLPIKIRG